MIERLGRYFKTVSGQLTFLVPFVDRIRAKVDMRERVVSFAPQPVITQDNLTLSIDTVVYFQVTNPQAAVYEISNYIAAVEQLADDSHDERVAARSEGVERPTRAPQPVGEHGDGQLLEALLHDDPTEGAEDLVLARRERHRGHGRRRYPVICPPAGLVSRRGGTRARRCRAAPCA